MRPAAFDLLERVLTIDRSREDVDPAVLEEQRDRLEHGWVIVGHDTRDGLVRRRSHSTLQHGIPVLGEPGVTDQGMENVRFAANSSPVTPSTLETYAANYHPPGHLRPRP